MLRPNLNWVGASAEMDSAGRTRKTVFVPRSRKSLAQIARGRLCLRHFQPISTVCAVVKPAEKSQVNPSIAHVSDEQFEEQVLKSSEPVLVDFWAEWCGPCKMIAPILDDVATSYAGKLRVAKINIDHNQKTPRNYNVRGIPTLMIFKDGKVQATQIGAVSKTQLTQLIDKTIA
jgi:thioredoxin 1